MEELIKKLREVKIISDEMRIETDKFILIISDEVMELYDYKTLKRLFLTTDLVNGIGVLLKRKEKETGKEKEKKKVP
jgi:hypothetical protein